MSDPSPLWIPTPAQIASANVTRFIRDAVQPLGGAAASVTNSATLYDWSLEAPEQFWAAVWR